MEAMKPERKLGLKGRPEVSAEVSAEATPAEGAGGVVAGAMADMVAVGGGE